MTIPKLHYISQGDSAKEHIDNIQKACTSGVELVQLNLLNVSEKKYLKLAKAVYEITSHFQTRLMINQHYKIAKEVKADGVFLGKSDCCPTITRKHLNSWQIIGSTANTIQDCKSLISKQVDYICLGPFKNSTVKDSIAKKTGLEGYLSILETLKTDTPIIGFGGITTNDVSVILKTGISGIAAGDAITRDFNSIKMFNQLLNASSTKEQRHTF